MEDFNVEHSGNLTDVRCPSCGSTWGGDFKLLTEVPGLWAGTYCILLLGFWGELRGGCALAHPQDGL